jgi:glycosyltransferase involved in cell wall biosynthesis
MNQNTPRVSVGLAVYNGETFVAQTIESILSQTFQDFELIISDNASTDRTEEICRAYAARDPRIRYYRGGVNRGAAWNHNRVFELAGGEYFKWNSADDLCAPEFLARCVAALDREPAAVMAVSEVVEIDELGRQLQSIPELTLLPVVPLGAPAQVRFKQILRLDHLCISIYSLIRSDALRRTNLIGGYPDSDRDLLAHLALFGNCAVVPEVLLFNRDHADRFSRGCKGMIYEHWRERTLWFDPSRAKQAQFPFFEKLFALWRVIPRSPLKGREQLRCYAVLIQWFLQKENVRCLYVDATHYPRKYVVRHFPWAKVAWNWLWSKKNVGDQVRNT